MNSNICISQPMIKSLPKIFCWRVIVHILDHKLRYYTLICEVCELDSQVNVNHSKFQFRSQDDWDTFITLVGKEIYLFILLFLHFQKKIRVDGFWNPIHIKVVAYYKKRGDAMKKKVFNILSINLPITCYNVLIWKFMPLKKAI